MGHVGVAQFDMIGFLTIRILNTVYYSHVREASNIVYFGELW